MGLPMPEIFSVYYSMKVKVIGIRIYFAVDFLKANTKSLLDSGLEDGKYVNTKGKNVVIIGGGDTGNDCVGTAMRHGCKSVTQIEMMPKAPDVRAENNPWPEWPKVCKTDYGQEEAIAVFGKDPRIYETTVKEFLKDKNGNLTAVKTVEVGFRKDEKSGRMVMAEQTGSEKELPCEVLIIATGFLGSEKYVTDAFQVEVDGGGGFQVYRLGDLPHGGGVAVLVRKG